MNKILHDIRFSYAYDNPFSRYPGLRDKVMSYLREHPNEFVSVSYPDMSVFVSVPADDAMLYGKLVKATDPTIIGNPLLDRVKKFIGSVNSKIGVDLISKEMQEWASRRPPETALPAITTTQTGGDVPSQSPDVSSSYYPGSYSPMMDTSVEEYGRRGVLTYDTTSDKCITLEELERFTRDIAKSRGGLEATRDETMIILERNKQKELIQDILRLKDVREIAAYDDSDISNLTIEQLEHLRDKLVEYSNSCKILDLGKRATSSAAIIYDAVFPEGIPIGKGKKIRFNGIGKEILNNLFDPHTIAGLACGNIIREKGYSVSDMTTVMVTIATAFISKTEVVDTKAEEKAKRKVKPKKPKEEEPKSEYYSDDELADVA